MDLAMLTNPFSAEGMFQLAAVTKFFSIFGHYIYGYPHYFYKFGSLPDTPEYRLAKYGSNNIWEYMSVSFGVEACIFWHWARTNGPSTLEDEFAFWALVVFGFIGGYRQVKMGYWTPLIPLWYANIFASLAYAMARSK